MSKSSSSSTWVTFSDDSQTDTASMLPPPLEKINEVVYSTVKPKKLRTSKSRIAKVLPLPQGCPSYSQLNDLYPLPHATVNAPTEYQRTIETTLSEFKTRPFVLEYKKYFILTESIKLALNNGNIMSGYVTGVPSLCFWCMEPSDVVDVNSVTYELARIAKLHGLVKYIDCPHYQSFRIDHKTTFVDSFDVEMPTPKTLGDGAEFQEIDGKVWLKINGLVHHMCNDRIEPIITIHKVKLACRDLASNQQRNLLCIM